MQKLLLFCLLPFCMARAQQTFIDSTITDTTAYARVVIEVGAHVPLGALKDKFGVSPAFGAWWRKRIAHNDMLDLGFNLYAPQNRREFTYTYQGEEFPTQAIGVSGMVGMRFCKVYSLGGKTSLEWVTSFGYAFFTYYNEYKDRMQQNNNAPRQRTTDDNTQNIDIDTYALGLSAIHVGQGVRLNVGRVSFYTAYNYTPYGRMSSRVPRNFGAHSLSLLLQVRI